MDYTLSVYLPEIAMQGQQHQVARDELADRAGLRSASAAASAEKPLLVQLLQQLKNQPQSSSGSPTRAAAGAAGSMTVGASAVVAGSAAASTTEEVKQVSTSKSPFRSSNVVGSGPQTKGSPGNDDEIEEDIVQDHEDIQLQQNSARDAIAASGGASSAVGVDQSIDTLRMEEFDWVEDVKHTPRGEI